MTQSRFKLKEILLLGVPPLCLVCFALIQSRIVNQDSTLNQLPVSGPYTLKLEQVKISQSSMVKAAPGDKKILVVIQCRPPYHASSLLPIPVQLGFGPTSIVNELGKAQYINMDMGVMYVSHAPPESISSIGASRHLVVYDLPVSRVPKSVGTLTLKTSIYSGKSIVPLNIKVR